MADIQMLLRFKHLSPPRHPGQSRFSHRLRGRLATGPAIMRASSFQSAAERLYYQSLVRQLWR